MTWKWPFGQIRVYLPLSPRGHAPGGNPSLYLHIHLSVFIPSLMVFLHFFPVWNFLQSEEVKKKNVGSTGRPNFARPYALDSWGTFSQNENAALTHLTLATIFQDACASNRRVAHLRPTPMLCINYFSIKLEKHKNQRMQMTLCIRCFGRNPCFWDPLRLRLKLRVSPPVGTKWSSFILPPLTPALRQMEHFWEFESNSLSSYSGIVLDDDESLQDEGERALIAQSG